MIFRKYLQGWFLLDVMSILPFDIVALVETDKVNKQIAMGSSSTATVSYM